MYRSRSFPLVLLVAINFLLNSPANAGVVKRSIRMVREVYPPDIEPENEGNQPQVCIVGDVVYGAEEAVPAEQPCLKCRCQPPGVQCETVQCAKKPGCKAIHRSNKCCPDYQCECEYNGKIYANGEKLEANPGGECKVCYCRGGEVQCAEVSCYIRKDCEGKRVPGTCCPKYDNCPPIDALPDRAYLTTESPSNTFKPVVLELWQDSTNSTDLPSLPTLNVIPEDSNKVPDTSDSATIPPIFQEIPKKDEGILPRITIQEIIPERKEIPITAPPKIFLSRPQGTLLIEEALPTNENTSNDLNTDTDAEPDSSEISEVFQHPPPILRIGDKLLFLKKGELVPEKNSSTPQSVITIIGAEGLQRGGVEESLEVQEVRIQPENNIQEVQNVDVGTSDKTELNLENLDAHEIKDTANSRPNEDPTNGSETNDLELRTSESTHILSLVKKKKNSSTVTSTTQEPTTEKEVLTTLTSNIEEPQPSEASKLITESVSLPETTVLSISKDTTDEGITSDTSTIPLRLPDPTTEPQTKNTEPAAEQNPAYPLLPDVMPAVGDVAQKFEIELENDNSTTMEIKIIPEVYDLLSNKTKNQTLNSEWLKINANNESLVSFKAAMLPDELLKQRSPIDVDDDTNTEITEVTALEAEANNDTDVGNATTTIQTRVDDNDGRSDAELEKETTFLKEDQITAKMDHEVTEKLKSVERNVKKDKLEEEGAQLIAEVKLSDDDIAAFDQTTSTYSILTIEPLNKMSSNVKESIPDNDQPITEINKETINQPNAEINKDDKVQPFTEINKETINQPNEEINKDDNVQLITEINKMPSEDVDKPIDPKNLLVEYIKTSDNSAESIEVDSGEQTTPKTNHSAMISNENASVEKNVKEGNSETDDMVLNQRKEGSIELGSIEIAETSTISVLSDVEMIETNTNRVVIYGNQTSTDNLSKQDVELINVMNIPKPTKMDKVESSTYELLPTPEETKSKGIIKREIASENSEEDVFKDLEKELNAENLNSNKNPLEEKSEAVEIFKELEDETKGTKVDTKPRSKEQEKVDDISNALAGFVLKGNAPDARLFRLIGGLFRGQNK